MQSSCYKAGGQTKNFIVDECQKNCYTKITTQSEYFSECRRILYKKVFSSFPVLGKGCVVTMEDTFYVRSFIGTHFFILGGKNEI